MKRILGNVVVGGFSGLVIIVGYILLRDNVTAGDWLQFVGAMLGTGLAVIGALYVEKHRRDHQLEQTKATLLDVLKQIDAELDEFAEPLTGDLNKDVGAINASRFFLESAKEYAEFVLKQHLLPDSKVWRSTSAIIHYIDRILDVTWSEYDSTNREDNITVQTVAHWHKQVTKIIASAKQVIEKVIAKQEGREVE